MSTMYVNNIAPLEGTTINVASGKTLNAPGHVIQVVQSTYVTPVDITSVGSFTHTGLTGTITPSSTSSKILILVDSPVRLSRGAGTGLSAHCQLYRNGSSVISDRIYSGYDNGDDWYDAFGAAIKHLDSPASISAVEYKLYARIGASTFNGKVSFQHGDGTSSITLMEIAG